MTTTATARRDHCNTSRSNALCHCRLGENHGDLPGSEREMVLRALLRGHDVTFIDFLGDTLVVPVVPSDTPKVRATLLRFNIEPQYRSSTDRGGRGLLVSGATWIR